MKRPFHFTFQAQALTKKEVNILLVTFNHDKYALCSTSNYLQHFLLE